MARSITEIEAAMIAAKEATPTLATLNNPSVTARWRLWIRIVASAIWLLEVLQEGYKAEVLAEVAKLKPHNAKWYQQKALDFQYGADLPEGSIIYDNSALDADQIATQKIIQKAAVTDSPNVLTVKVAKVQGTNLVPLDGTEKGAFESYMGEIKDAGVNIKIISQTGDSLRLTYNIYYDALVLNADGERLDGADASPVQNAITKFIQSVGFNDLFVPTYLTDELQQIDGVEVPVLTLAQAASTNGGTYNDIAVQYRPEAGYMQVYQTTDLVLNFISYTSV